MWIGLAVLALVIIAAVVGGVVGTRAAQTASGNVALVNSNPASAVAASVSSGSQASSSGTSTGVSQSFASTYGDRRVIATVRRLLHFNYPVADLGCRPRTLGATLSTPPQREAP